MEEKVLEIVGSKATKALSTVLNKHLGILSEPVKKIIDVKADNFIEEMRLKHHHKIEKIDLLERAKRRLLETEIRRQCNLEDIGVRAMSLLDMNSKPQEIDVDWLHHFAQSAQDVSEVTLRELWARILAGEANSKGSFSRRTLETLKNFSKEDCKILESLGTYAVTFSNVGAYLKEVDYGDKGVSYSQILHLDHMGIVILDTSTQFIVSGEDEDDITYCEEKIPLKNIRKNETHMPAYYISKVGSELLRIIPIKKNDQILEDLKRYFKKKKLIN